MASENHYHIIEWHFHSYSQGLFLLLWFIVILIFLPALFLCVHFCRRCFSKHPTSTADATATATADATSMISELPAHQCVSVDYTNHTILPISSTTKSLSMVVGAGFEKKECCICLSHFQDNEKLKVLIECQHAYHSECLDMWLSAHPSCPLCRSSLHVSNSPKKSIISSELRFC